MGLFNNGNVSLYLLYSFFDSFSRLDYLFVSYFLHLLSLTIFLCLVIPLSLVVSWYLTTRIANFFLDDYKKDKVKIWLVATSFYSTCLLAHILAGFFIPLVIPLTIQAGIPFLSGISLSSWLPLLFIFWMRYHKASSM